MKIVLGNKRDENAQDKKVIEKTKKGFLSKFAKKKVISEQFDKRDACSKHFKMSDGSYQAVLYNEAVHFWDKDKKQFVDIDNRLTFKAKDNNKVNDFDGFENVNNAFKVKFARESTYQNIFNISTEDYELAWKIIDAQNDKRRRFFPQASLAEVKEQRLEKANKVASLKYREVFPNTDIEYKLSGSKVKEDIVVRKKADKYEYVFEVTAKNLNVKLEDNQIKFVSKKDEKEVVFNINKPVMYDALGKQSDALWFEIEEKTSDVFTFKLFADENWINSEEVTLPVYIDPSIVYTKSTSPKLRYCTYGDTTEKYNRFLLQRNNKVLLDFDLPSLSGNAVITSARLSVHNFWSNTEAKTWNIYKLNSGCVWNFNTQVAPSNITYNAGEIIELFSNRNKEKDVSADLTRYVKRRMAGETNYGLIIVPQDGANHKSDFLYDDYTAPSEWWPHLTIDYIEPRGNISSSQTYFDVNMGDAGVAKVNMQTGVLSIANTLINLPGNNMPLALQLIYNQLQENTYGVAKDFKLNVMHKISSVSASSSEIDYWDSGNAKHTFVGIEDETGKYFIDTSGSGMTLTCNSTGGIIQAPDGSKLNFNTSCKLTSFEDQFGKKMTLTYNSSGYVASVTDGIGRVASFTYSNGNLSKITIGEYVVDFVAGTYLTSVAIPGKGTITYTYGNNGYIKTVENPCGQKYEFIYDSANKVEQVLVYSQKETITANSMVSKTAVMEEKYTIEYFAGNKTTVTNNKGVPTAYHFENGGKPVAIGQCNSIVFDGDVQYFGQSRNSVQMQAKIPYSVPLKGASMETRVDKDNTNKLIYTCSAAQLEEFKGKFVVLSAFAQGEASVKGEFALSLKVTRSGSSIEWFDANFDPTNSQYQFSATGTYIPTDCTALQIYGKYAGNINHATFDSIKMTACDATATQSLLYLKTSSSSNEIPVPMNKLTSVSFKRNQNYYDLDTETITTEVIDDELDIDLFSSYDLKKLLAGKTDKLTYGAYVYDPASDIKFNTEANAQYPLANGVKLGSVVYSPQGILYTKNINLTTDFKTGLPTSSYYVQTADNTGFSTCDTKYYTAKNLLYKHVNNRGIVTEYTYESTHGNPTQIKIYDKNDASKYFLQTTSYADNGDRVSQESDEANNSTQNIYDNVGFADAVIDGKGNRTEYCTTHDDFMLKCMCQQATNGHAYTHFGYNAGLLTDLTKNNFAYDFVYNGMTDIKQVKIAGQNYLTATKNKTTTNDTSVVEYANGQKNETVTDKYGRVTSSKDYLVRPDSSVFDFGNIQNTYDYSHTNAKLTKHIDNHIGTVINYSYDRYGAVKEASESIGGTLLSKVVNTKDSKNRLTQRVTTLGPNNGNTSVTNVYTYDSNALDGRLTNETIKLGTAQKASFAYNYDNFGRLTAKNGLQNVSYTYNTLSGGSRLTNQVKRVTYHDGSHDEYTYDKNGNITKVTLSTGDTVEYVYDSFNRLVEEINCVLNQRTFFTYDNSGNITQKRIVKCEEQSDVTINYAYTNAWKDQLTSIGGQAITYDAIGNPISYKGNTLYWSRGRMLERFGDKACYTYNSAGIRTEKCIKNKATKYVVSGSTILSETTDGVSTIYYHGTDGVIGFNRAGVDYFYRKNMQGDIIAIVNASGAVVVKYVYDAWGNHKVFNSAGTVIYDSQNPTSTYANEIGYINSFRYRGYYFDNETGLYYLNSRYYDPQVGRFINADTINYMNPKNLNGLNLYSYCLNNPIMLSDPMGTSVDWGKVLGWALVAVIAIALVATAAYYVAAISTVTSLSASTAVVAATSTKLAASALVGASLGYTIGVGSSVEKQGGFANADPLNVLDDGFTGAVIGGLSGLASAGASYLMETMGLSFGLSVNSMRVMGVSVGSVFSSGLVINGIKNAVTIMSGLAAGTTINAIGNCLIGNNLDANSIATQGLQGEMPMWLVGLLNWLF